MTHNKKKQFGINVVSGWIQQGVRIFVGFFMLPYAMSRLGQEEYGIYQLAFSAIVFLNFLQIGMGPTLIRFAAQAIAGDDDERVKKISSSSQFLLAVIGFIGMAGILMMIPFFLKFYSIKANLVSATSRMMICLALSFFFSFFSIAQNSLLLAANRYELSNGIAIIQNVSRVVFAVLLFEFIKPSLFFYGIAIALSNGIRALFLFYLVIRNIGRKALFSIRSIRFELIKEMVGFSFLVMIQSVAYTSVFQGPSLIIGKIWGPEMVALFAPALLVATSMQAFIGQSLNPIVTLAAQEKMRSEDNKLGKWALQISQMVAFAGFGFLILFFLFGNEVVGMWLGSENEWLWKVIFAVSIGAVLLPIQGVVSRMAIGASNIKASVFSMVILAMAVLVGSILGMAYGGWDIFNVALFMGICISIRSFYIVFYYSMDFKFNFWTYCSKVYLNTAIVSVCIIFMAILMTKSLNFHGIIWGLFRVTSVAALYVLSGWYLLLPNSFKVLLKQKLMNL